MKLNLSRSTNWLLLSCITISSALMAAPKVMAAPEKGEAAESAKSEGDAHEKLEGAMETLEKCYKRLKAQLPDKAKNEASLETLLDMQAATIEAKSVLPTSIARMPADKQAEASASYHALMISLLRHELELEEQVRAGQNEKAVETFKALGEIEKAGHAEFRAKRPKKTATTKPASN